MQNNQECFGISGRSGPPRNSIILYTGNGRGSTSTGIRRYSNILKTGYGLSYTDDPIQGMSILVLVGGVYSITISDGNTATGTPAIGITVNENLGTSGTSTVGSTTVAMGKRASATCGSGILGSASSCLPLNAGDVIRAHTDNTANLTTDGVMFVITQVTV